MCCASFANVRVGQWLTARKSIRYENIAPLSLSSLRLSPSAPDFRALPRAFLCRFPYLLSYFSNVFISFYRILLKNILHFIGIQIIICIFATERSRNCSRSAIDACIIALA